MNRKILLLPLLLFPAGCDVLADGGPVLRTAAVAGDPTGLAAFAGSWYDDEGHLMAVISDLPAPQLRLRTPYDLEPRDVRLRRGEIVFRMTSEDPEEVSLQLTGKDRLRVSLAARENPPSPATACSCRADRLSGPVLVRNPPAPWLVRQSVHHAAEWGAAVARRAYASAWNWLARVL